MSRRRAGWSAAAGAAGGLLSGLLGGGGGAVMVPLMTGPLGMRQHVAHGTSLVVITATAAVAAVLYGAAGHFDAVLFAGLAAGALSGAYAGAKAAMKVPALRLRQLFGLFLLAVSLRLLVFEPGAGMVHPGEALEAGIALVIGLAGGLASGALGVGGGAIFVPAMVVVLGIGQHEAQGISLVVIVLASAMGALTHYRQGTVDAQAARWLAPAAVPGAIAGAGLATILSGRELQVVFAVVLSAIGVQMLVTATRRLRAAAAASPAAGAVRP
ncbi:sulfite exporter TauE/SafE family protein [Tepidiforma sp.]|uniref:sulfite exporter TauE/SafE family protein n=1 Tax=Tepidiforma sp. TaxID=2682230 RepID=UPI002ADE5DA9|nr:sulfite exporter TauE/SafE family protein [Tepidiforma sp.]